MGKTEDKRLAENYDKYFKSKRLQASMYTFSITLSNVAFFSFLGYLVDKYFPTEPYGLIVGIVISFPIGQFMVYKKLKQLLKK
ncbi:MAG: hypothetical protein UR28_C0013G0002 [Candidatus Peregrinibacteria bacterium GW2011_GWF2_33_10]|nr:MAG: hypothetical protein UR28_C0013G0002 [Candidatus Peregrinibacteria bacterium GW2011_GWF2_33_10]OGJ45763.1 MAG: hypothetical protein A2263_01165 [Candidatus Peregrinibacteria bacterium RIFOXYA2_FULL_33_21]OGJ46823.1 MAG: hypothetical protein A2272_00765 [Candidatus Peregrinibacteria bacterium RIFOXYA12_FULL_33_12]OGJ51293.1 MAG: hypothetical protein A2307_00440 [Candidatus Peregrinibacteria bacterium RIFOXYB2_FULL_33_20]